MEKWVKGLSILGRFEGTKSNVGAHSSQDEQFAPTGCLLATWQHLISALSRSLLPSPSES